MRKFSIEISEQNLNLLWRSLNALEENLLKIIAAHEDDPEGELATFSGNDLVYLRLYKDDLEKAAKEAKFSENMFRHSDEVIKPKPQIGRSKDLNAFENDASQPMMT